MTIVGIEQTLADKSLAPVIACWKLGCRCQLAGNNGKGNIPVIGTPVVMPWCCDWVRYSLRRACPLPSPTLAHPGSALDPWRRAIPILSFYP
jgi:hypothetical protein